MKVASKIGVFVLASLVGIACFEEPQFPIEPEIELIDYYMLKDILYGDSDVEGDYLFIKFRFRDGDGDLGIPEVVSTDGRLVDNYDFPYHERNYYLVDAVNHSVLHEIGTNTFYTDTFRNNLAQFVPLTILEPKEKFGKLLTIENQHGFTGNTTLPALPPFDVDHVECYDYTVDTLYVFEDNWSMIDASYTLDNDTVVDAFGNRFILLADTVYFRPNPNYHNFEINFFVNDIEFDWRREFCTTYDGRFPVLSDGSSPVEGEITYAIPADFFEFLFSIRRLKLKIKIRDAALHESNEVSTPEFVLSDIVRSQ